MKNLFVAFALSLVCIGSLSAQTTETKTFTITEYEGTETIYKPGAGSFSMEASFSPFNTEGNDISLSGGRLLGIYSMTDNWGIRLGLGFSNFTEESEDVSMDEDLEELSLTSFSLAPGLVYTFSGTKRLAPYVGAEIVFETASSETEDSSTSLLSNEMKYNSFGANLFTGFNYYFAQNIYIGLEMGLGFENRKVTTEVSNEVNGYENTQETKYSTVGVFAAPSIRLGWTF